MEFTDADRERLRELSARDDDQGVLARALLQVLAHADAAEQDRARERHIYGLDKQRAHAAAR